MDQKMDLDTLVDDSWEHIAWRSERDDERLAQIVLLCEYFSPDVVNEIPDDKLRDAEFTARKVVESATIGLEHIRSRISFLLSQR